MITPADAVITREMSIDEINAAIPRRVYLSGEGQTALQVILGILLFGLVWVAAISYFDIRDKHESEALARGGRETITTITRIGHGRGTTYVYYTFSLGDSIYGGRARVPGGQYIRVRVGDRLPVQFLPYDPFVNHPSGWAWWTWSDLLPYALGLMFFGIGVKGLVSIYLRRRLARIGWVTEGKVIACAPKGSRFRVDYEFYNEDQTLFDGANEYSYDEYQYGAKIRLIYMRHNPKRNDTYPLADFPIVGS